MPGGCERCQLAWLSTSEFVQRNDLGESSLAEMVTGLDPSKEFRAESTSSNRDSPHAACDCGRLLRARTVNKIVSKHFKFSENSRSILIETAQNREQPVQGLSVIVMAC